MSNNDSLAVEAVAILAEGLVVEVVLDLLLEEVRFADEEVGAPRGIHQALGPFRVARVDDHLPAVLDAQGVGGRAASVLDEERRDASRSDEGRRALPKPGKLDGEAAVYSGRARKEHLHRRLDALPHSGWSADHERPCPPTKLPIEDEERQAPEVISMEMGQQHVASRPGPPRPVSARSMKTRRSR